MASIRLNLAALRHSVSDPDALPRTPPGRGLADLLVRPVSRRTALQVTGGAVAGFVPVLDRLHVLLGGLALYGDEHRLVFALGDRGRWAIDARRFAGTPTLRHARHADGAVHIELRGARFPGTGLPADFVGVIQPGLIGSRMRLHLELGDFRTEVPFEDWLVGKARARGRVNLDGRACRLGRRSALTLSGRGEAEITPDGALRLSGPGVAALIGLGEDLRADDVTLAVAEPDTPNLVDPPAERRTLIALERGARSWGWHPQLPLNGPGGLSFVEEPFDRITLETGESGRRVRRGLVAHGAAERTAAFWYVPGLVDGAGEPARLPLNDARYAVAFDRSGDRRAFLARFAEPVWLHGHGFSIEVAGSSESPGFDLVTRSGTVVEFRCEPTLRRTVVPVSGAVVEPARPPEGSRIALADGVGDGPAPAAHLEFGSTRREPRLVLKSAPPLALMRPTDLLAITFEFVNLGLKVEGAGQASLVREPTRQLPASFLVVRFAPQNIAERAFFERARDADGDPIQYQQRDSQGNELKSGAGYEKNPNGNEEPDLGDIPVKAVIAGRSRLAFVVPDDMPSLPYRLDALLDWSRLEPSVVAAALPPPPPPSRIVAARPMAVRMNKPVVKGVTTVDSMSVHLKTQVRVDAESRQSVARLITRNLKRKTLTPEQIESLAATLTQSRSGLTAIARPSLAGVIAELLKRPQKPQEIQTAIETPWRLVLSPNGFSAWAHSVNEVSSGPETAPITELWHTRLGVRRGGEVPPGQSAVDETEDYYRTLRAVWSPDYDPDGGADQPPHFPQNDPGNPFRMSLDARDRHELVALTSDFQIPNAEERVVRAERFMLTALGAWMNVRGGWRIPVEAQDEFSLEEWRHRATLGRDQFVKVVYRGYLFPFGHAASLIKVTERKLDWTRSQQTAFLRQRMYVVVRQPEKTYPGLYQPHDGRKFPFQRVRIETRVTPSLDDPATTQIVGSGADKIPGRGQGAFWLRVADKDFLFHMVAEDVEGQTVEFTTPLAFIDGKYAVDGAVAKAAAAELATSPARAMRPTHGQRVAYAESRKSGDTTFETASLTFGAEPVEGADDLTLRTLDQPRFYPALDGASVEIPAVKQLAGVAGAVAISYPKRYLDRGFASGGSEPNDGQVFAQLAKAAGLSFGGGSAGTDRVGALVNPDLSIQGLSRLSGPVSGDIDEVMKASFDPQKFFAGLDVKLLGGVSLLDIVQAVTGFDTHLDALKNDLAEQLGSATANVTPATLRSLPKSPIPAFLTQLLYDKPPSPGAGAQLPKQIQLAFKWDPRVASAGPFRVDGSPDDTLSLSSVALIPITPEGQPGKPSYTVAADLQNFTLDLFSIIAVKIASVRFAKRPGAKPDVSADVKDVSFEGPLHYVNELQSLIPSDGFTDPPSLDVTPTGLRLGYSLGLPTIGVGVFTLQNISLGGALTVPFTGDPVRFRFNFCAREAPFILTVYGLGGGGFFAIEVGLDGVEALEASLEFGASLAVDLGVASGGVSVMGGVYYAMESDTAKLDGHFRMSGALEVLGLIAVSLVFYMALTYQDSPEMVWGEATLTVEVEVAFFSKDVDISVRKEFATPPPPSFSHLMTEDEWLTYRLAFAS